MTKTVAPQKSSTPTPNPLAAKLEAKHAAVLEAMGMVCTEALKGAGEIYFEPPHGFSCDPDDLKLRRATDSEASILELGIFIDKGVDAECDQDELIERTADQFLERGRLLNCVGHALKATHKKGLLAELIGQLESSEAT